MAAVETSHLRVAYDDHVVLEDVTFAVNGRILAVLGANGSGKSSLLHCVSGLLPPRSGEVRIHGQCLASMKRRTLAQEVTVVTQEHHPAFSFYVEDVVLMGRTPYVPAYAAPSRADRRIAHETMERVGVTALKDRPYTELSGGERKLVLIAMALCQDTKVIVLDEPTAFLDARNATRVLGLVRRMAQDAGKTVLIAMHDVNHALACADEALLIVDSRTVIQGQVDDVITEETLGAVYRMPFETATTQAGRRVFLPEL